MINTLNTVSDEISIRDLFRKLLRWIRFLLSKWIIIVIASLLGAIGGFVYAALKKPVYTAELTFVLDAGGDKGMANYAGIASQFGLNMGGGGEGVFEGENFLMLMKSRLMMEKALLTPISVNGKSITLAEYYIQVSKLREKWKEDNSILKDIYVPLGLDQKELSTNHNILIGNLHGRLTKQDLFIGKLDDKSSIITLRVQSIDELFSKYFVEILAKEVSEFYIETKTKKSTDNIRILQHQTDSIRRALTSSMIGAATAADANPNPNLARQILVVPSQRRLGDAQANQAILTQLVQNLEISKMTLRSETPLIQVIDRPVLPLPMYVPGRINYLILGGMLLSFAMICFLIIKRLLDTVLIDKHQNISG